jgi:crotonobetainyl-CoA:carnitine CoA-transferase CaiB-like acyl-CoA transferase
VHGTYGVLMALRQHRQTGRGQLLEQPMVEVVLNAAAAQIVEYGEYGLLPNRNGNRAKEAAPQGVYVCEGTNNWVAISITTDREWADLCKIMGSPDWSIDPALMTHSGRQERHDIIDQKLSAWLTSQDARSVASALRDAGVPAAPVVHSFAIDEDEQMRERRFWEPVTHPIVGTVDYPGWPFRLGDGPPTWHSRPAPLLGQHTDEVLRQVGISEAELLELRRTRVIGSEPLGL